jgi:hypothetical protein
MPNGANSEHRWIPNGAYPIRRGIPNDEDCGTARAPSSPSGISRSSGFRAVRDFATFGIRRRSASGAACQFAPFGIARR